MTEARPRQLGTALVALVCLCGMAASRNAYRELRGSKQYYARLVRATEQFVPAGGYVLADIWWFDQITAALYTRHTTLFAAAKADKERVRGWPRPASARQRTGPFPNGT